MAEFCEQAALTNPDSAAVYSEFAELYQRKIWHQLTIAVQKFVADDQNSGEPLLKLYNEFISKFDAKINQLHFVQILTAIGRKQSDPAVTAELFSAALGKADRLGPEPSLLLRSELGLVNLQRGQSDAIKVQIAKDKAALEELDAADPCVHSAHHLLASEYYKQMGPPEAYFKSALMYLAYTPLETLSNERQYELATDISLAAITGEGVFNFGEVVSTPAVKALAGTPNAWLQQLLDAFNRGDIDAFDQITGANSSAIQKQPALVSRAAFVKEKMALMSLINMVFERPSHERDIPFSEMAARTRLPVDQVEWLIMRAMSLGLVKGMMDEVDQTAHISWVQPRALDKDQIAQLLSRLEAWKTSVSQAHVYMESLTPELFV